MAVIETFERRITSVQFDAELTKYTFDRVPEDRENVQSARLSKGADGDKCFYKTSVVVDYATGRYRVNINAVIPWQQGAVPVVASGNSYSYDGRSERSYVTQKNGFEVPEPNDKGVIRNGLIDKERKNRFLNERGINTGIGEFPPLCRNMLLSELMRSQHQDKKPVVITKIGTGEVWRIQAVDPVDKLGASIDFDTLRGCVCQIELTARSESVPFIRIYFDLVEYKPGLWVPWRRDMMALFGKFADRTTFRNIKINEPVADESIFRVVFPAGAFVEDRIEKMYYRVGSNSSDEKLKIQQFTAKHELALALENGEIVPGPWWPWLAGGLGLASCCAVGYYLYRRKAMRRTFPVVVLLSVGFLSTPASAAEFGPKGTWNVSHARGEIIPITQCGSNVTFFSLEYFHHQHYQVKNTLQALPPSNEGIRMSDIRDVLDSYGLRTFARQKVTLRDLKRVIRAGTLGIMPIKLSEDRHHYIVLMRDPRRGLLLVDPPHDFSSFEDNWVEKHLPDFDGVVLLVRQDTEKKAAQNELVAMTPDHCDLGTFDPEASSSSELLEKTLTLRNTSDRAIMVTGVKTSCGCVGCKWAGGILAPGASQDVPLTILPNAWGIGRVERYFTFQLGDGTECVSTWIATGLLAEKIQQLEVKPDIARIDLGAIPENATRITREVDVLLGPVNVNKIMVTSSVAWLTGSVEPVDQAKAKLKFHVDVAGELSQARAASGEIRIASTSDGTPVRLRVEVKRPSPYTAEPSILVLNRKDKKSGLVRLQPQLPEGGLQRAFSVLSCPKALQVELGEWDKDGPFLKVGCQEQLPRGPHCVKCAIGYRDPATKRVSTVIVEFVVMLEP